jgi:hypothetical protein
MPHDAIEGPLRGPYEGAQQDTGIFLLPAVASRDLQFSSEKLKSCLQQQTDDLPFQKCVELPRMFTQQHEREKR